MTYRISTLNNASLFVVAGFFLLGLANSTLAQGAPTGPPPGLGPPVNKNPNLDEHARQVDESRLRSAEMDAGIDFENQKRLQAVIANMKEDFTRIQVLRNDIARSLIARKPLDYKLISEQTAEINKRSNRLNVYMRARGAQDNEEKNSPEFKSEDMIGKLVKLCKLIDSFTENPVLKNAATIDPEGIAKAKENKANADRDLLAIIRLSASLQKTLENLKRSQ